MQVNGKTKNSKHELYMSEMRISIIKLRPYKLRHSKVFK